MPPCPLLKGATDSREVPDVLSGCKTIVGVLWPQNPRVIRKPAFGVCSRIGIHHLARRRNTNGRRVESELLGVFDKMKEVSVAAAEFVLAVDAKSVIPDDPTAAEESEVPLENELHFGRQLVPNCQPERPGGLERSDQCFTPVFGPAQIFICRAAVFVYVV